MEEYGKLRKNPSRETCESIIQRILLAEIQERGKNQHFKKGSDFLPYFESLYPASDSLTKQVQRAVKSLDMAKDSNGFFIINKTSSQLQQEQELKHFFQISNTMIDRLENCNMVFLKAEDGCLEYLMHLLSSSDTFRSLCVTMTKTYNGVIIYTRNKLELLFFLNQLLESSS